MVLSSQFLGKATRQIGDKFTQSAWIGNSHKALLTIYKRHWVFKTQTQLLRN